MQRRMPLQTRHDDPPQLQKFKRIHFLVEMADDLLLICATIHQVARDLESFRRRIFPLEAVRCADDASKETLRNALVYCRTIHCFEKLCEDLRCGRSGEGCEMYLPERVIGGARTDDDGRHFIKKIGVLVKKNTEIFFVRRANHDGKVIGKTRRDE